MPGSSAWRPRTSSSSGGPGCGSRSSTRRSSIAFHQSGRNSGVIHAGLYYTPGLPAQPALPRGPGAADPLRRGERDPVPADREARGRRERRRAAEAARAERAREPRTGCRACGSSATPERARDRAERRRARGAARPRERDHRLPRGRRARSPQRITAAGGSLLLGHAVLGVHARRRSVTLETTGGSVTSRGAIACSGASSDRIAQLAGVDMRDYRMVPFRGSYSKLVAGRRGLINGLVYPVPDPSLPVPRRALHPRGSTTTSSSARTPCWRSRDTATAGSRSACATPLATASFPGFWRLARRYPRYAAIEVSRDLIKPLLVREMQRYVPSLQAADVERGAERHARATAPARRRARGRFRRPPVAAHAARPERSLTGRHRVAGDRPSRGRRGGRVPRLALPAVRTVLSWHRRR